MTLRIFSALSGLILMLFLLTACTSGNFDPEAGTTLTDGRVSSTPISEQIGTSGPAVGLIAFDSSGALSEGAPDSIYLAGKLAVASLSGSPVILHIRKYKPTDTAIIKASKEFADRGVDFVIGPADGEGATVLANAMAGQGAAIVSMSPVNDIGNNLYAAAFDPELEAAVAVNEMARRKFANIVIAATTDAEAQTLAAKIKQFSSDAGIGVRVISAVSAAQISKELMEMQDTDFSPAAIFFATGPARAAAAAAAMKKIPQLALISVVGNSAWAVGVVDKTALAGAWYAGLDTSQLEAFATRFKQAYGQPPTLQGAFVYDLIVMAGALPQVVSEDPYNVDVLSNPQGFTGQTGAFKFTLSGRIERKYVVVSVK